MNRPTPSSLRGRDGYSMVEIIAIVTIIGILVSLAVPRFDGALRANRLDRVLDGVTADLSLTRMTAVRRGRPAHLLINSAGTGYQIVVENTPTVFTPVKSVNLASEHRGVILSPFLGMFRFDSRGLRTPAATTTSDSIVSTKDQQSRVLRISVVGRVYRER